MKKKIIIIILIIIGLIFIVFGIINYQKNKSLLNDNSIDNLILDTKENIINDTTLITNYSTDNGKEIVLKTFEVRTFKQNYVSMVMELTNNTSNDINDKLFKINFYQNETFLGTYDYNINNLKSSSTIVFETELPVNYKDITKYEIEIDGFKTEIKAN